MNLFNRRKDRCEEYTVEIQPRQGMNLTRVHQVEQIGFIVILVEQVGITRRIY